MMQAPPSKEKILAAARDIFVARGYAGASIGDIAKKAQVNHSLVFYHFKNKESLWLAVKLNIACDAQQLSQVLPKGTLCLSAFIHHLLKRSVAFYQENPDLVRMIAWQRLEYSTAPEIGLASSPEMEAWICRIAEYQSTGEMVPHIKPAFVMTMILAISSAAAMDNYLFMENKGDLEAYLDFTAQTILKMIALEDTP